MLDEASSLRPNCVNKMVVLVVADALVAVRIVKDNYMVEGSI